jgi:hypothetical protein
MFKIGMAFDPAMREKQWQCSCPGHQHQLIAKVKVRYQQRSGKIIITSLDFFRHPLG